MNKEDYEYIQPIIRHDKNCLIRRYKNSKNLVIQNAISHLTKITSFLPCNIDLKVRLYCFINNITEYPKCKLQGCNNHVNYYNGHFTQYCCDKHRRIGSPFIHNIPHTEKGKENLKIAIKRNGGRFGKKNSNYGKKASEETKRKLSLARSRWKHTRKHIEKWKSKMAFGAKERGKKISQTYRNKIKDHPEIITETLSKQHETKRINNSFNKSSPEDRLFLELQKKYLSVIRNYKEDRYPYLCDFYIPDLDLFIEYNEFWHHNNHIFDISNRNDLKVLKEWKEKALQLNKPNQYTIAIRVWTQSDPKKLEIAVKNKLNYLILWNWDDVEKFLKRS